MKKNFLLTLVAVGLSTMMTGCFGGGAGIDSKVDAKVLENKEGVQKLYDAVLKSMGEQAGKVNEVTIVVQNPADKGNSGDAFLFLYVDVQDPKNPKQLLRHLFHGEVGGWQPAQQLTVDVSGSDDEKASFRLEDELFDFKTLVSGEKLHKLIVDAYEKDNKEPEKYAYRYVDNVTISIEGFRISVKSKLASNDQIIDQTYRYDLEGNHKD
ncbi:MAG: hypothetical protein LBS01_00300 [Prevotellaceae bacterium]|jgi:hypothetical protein|nr:hypothetical protein [Prevotellaceae bacterium]